MWADRAFAYVTFGVQKQAFLSTGSSFPLVYPGDATIVEGHFLS